MIIMDLVSTRDASDVRQQFSRFVDDVVRVSPQVVQRRQRDVFMAVSLEHLRYMVAGARLRLEYSVPEPNSYVGTLWPFRLVDEATTYEELVEKLAQQAILYAKDYFDDFQLFMSAPNTREQLPHITNIMLQKDIEGVVRLIDGQLG